MIDIHSHFLPNIDDGPDLVNESLLMLSDSLSQGVEACVATPHCIIHKKLDIEIFLSRRNESLHILQKEINDRDIKCPKLILGAEVFLDNDLASYPGIELLCIENTSCILVEFPIGRLNTRTSEWIYSLIAKGLQPIIAHVERYPEEELEKIGLWELPLIYQINASRFLTLKDRLKIRKIMRNNSKFIISSDMHNMGSRISKMDKAYLKAKKAYPDNVEDLFINNAKKLLGL